MDLQRVTRLCGQHELARAQTQQIVFSHQLQNPFVIDPEPTLLQFHHHPAIAVAAPVLHGNPLHLGSQLHILLDPIALLQGTVKPGPAYPCQPTHALDTETALHRHHFPDLLVDAVPPVFSLCWRRAPTFCKAPLKKSTSRVFSASNWFTSRNCCRQVLFSSSRGV